MVGRLLSYAVMFVVPLVNVRSLSVEEYGYYRQFWLILETLTPMLILGFSRSLLYYLPRHDTREERGAYITQTVMFLITGSLIAVVIYSLMGHYLGEGLGAAARAFYWRLCFFTLGWIGTDYMEVIFVAQEQPLAQSIYHATAWGTQALVVIVSSYLSHDVNTIIWALTFYSAARLLFAIIYTNARYKLSFSGISWQTIREQAHFAIPVGLAGIALILVSQTDKFIISRYMGREAFAVYSVGAFQVPLANIIQTSIGNVTFPLISKYQKAGNLAAMADLWRRATIKTATLFFPMFVFLELSARSFITILFTDKYAAATPVFMIYMLLFLRSSVETGAIIQACNRTVFVFVCFFVGFAVNVALGIMLFKAIGRLGVPISAVFTMTAIGVVTMVYSARLVNMSVFKLFPTADLMKRFAAAALPGGVLWLAYKKFPVTNFFQLLAACAIYTLMYAIVCWVTKLVTFDDVRSMFGRAPVQLEDA
ncbi:MAG TPA: oligosaccharide flippase family protein [Candidatus Krumholzibacteria bacterium]|nr:oligosaccharide flippase family protein [Candidatus Krumholzibacteria bacterium]